MNKSLLLVLPRLALMFFLWTAREIRAEHSVEPMKMLSSEKLCEGIVPMDCTRLVTLAPSVTEVVASVGLLPQLQGVTRFDRYPPEVLPLPKIGGFLDVNVEAILQLHPTSVFGPAESISSQESLKRFNIPVVLFEHRTVSGILDSVRGIGCRCGIPEKVIQGKIDELLHFQRNFESRKKKRSSTPQVLVLLTEGNPSGQIYYASGKDGFYTELLEMIGAENVLKGDTLPLPSLSIESIINLHPDVVLFVSQEPQASFSIKEKLPTLLQEVQECQIAKPYAVIPGTRFPLLLQDIAQCLYPELYSRESELPVKRGDSQ